MNTTAAFLCAIVIFFTPLSAFADISPSVIFSLTNNDRAAQGLPPLSENTLLDQAAQMKANDMAAKGYYSHITPEGYAPFYWFDKIGYTYLNVGENLDLIYSGDEQTINNAWMGSPGHRANILQPLFTEIGVAVAVGKYRGVEGTFAVQLFGTPLPPTAPPVIVETTPVSTVTSTAVKTASTTAPKHVAPVPIKMIRVATSSPVTTTPTPTPTEPLEPILRVPYSPHAFVFSLQTFTLSLKESTHQLFLSLFPDGVY